MILGRDYLVHFAEAKNVGARRTEAQKEALRQELKDSLLQTLVVDMGLDQKRGGQQVKELILAGRAAFNQGEYLANFSDDQIRAGEQLALLKELSQAVRQIKAEVDSLATTNTFLHQNLTEFILPIFSSAGADSQILVTKMSRTDLLITSRPADQKPPEPVPIPVPEPVPEPPKPKGILERISNFFASIFKKK